VTCLEKGTSTDCTSAMIASTSIINQTQVKYLLKAGTPGKSYQVIVKVTTSNSQKLECVAEIAVI
jgi:tRNA-dihydrouridine synthase